MESEMGPEMRGPVGPEGDDSPFARVEPQPQQQPQPYPAPAWPGYGQIPGGPGPYGYPPYGYGYGYGGPPQPPAGSNGLAIAALVLGICGFFFVTPIVGLILGIIALSAVRKTGQRGKGMAIWGIALSSLWIAVFATAITVAVVTKPDPAQRDAGGNVVKAGAVSIFGLHPGDCFTVPAGMIGRTDNKARDLTVVPCSTPHDSEAIGSFTASENSYPGTDALRAESMSKCLRVLDSFVTDPGSLPTGSLIQYIFPNAQAWRADKHSITCFIQFPSATVTHSVYRDAATDTATTTAA